MYRYKLTHGPAAVREPRVNKRWYAHILIKNVLKKTTPFYKRRGSFGSDKYV